MNTSDVSDKGQLTVFQDSEDLIMVSTADIEDLTSVVDQLPKTLVSYSSPVILQSYDPKKDPLTDEEARMIAMSRFVSPMVQVQEKGCTDKPVVTTSDKILNSILPPRTFILHDSATGRDYLAAQPVSDKQVTRPQLTSLLKEFELRLIETKARLTGQCHVRSSIYAMLFDEFLRQVTIDCPERGLLLLRIRDESRMTIDALKSLYEAASQYGAKKLHETTRGKSEMMERINILTAERDILKKEEHCLRTRMASLQRCVEEQAAADRKRHAEEAAFLENSNLRLQQHLDSVRELQEHERKALLSGEG